MKREKRTKLHSEIGKQKQAIKEKCYDCMCGSKKIDCLIEDCSLYRYRPFFKNKTNAKKC
ncbi:MAG: hypothetical protein WC437_01920 [Patescibacteria group bacterium]